MALAATTSNDATNNFGFGAGLTDDGSTALKAAEESQYGPDCDIPTDSVGPDFDLGSLMTARLFTGGYQPFFARKGGPPKAPPADALLRGEAFRLTAGPRTSTDSCFGDVCSEEEHYVITFTPAR